MTAKERWLSDYFNLDPEDMDWAARWNVAPTQDVATVRQDRKEPKRIFALMRWGFAISVIGQTGQSEAIHSPEAWASMVVRFTKPAAWSTAVVCTVAISCCPRAR